MIENLENVRIKKDSRTKYPKIIIKHDLTITLSVPKSYSKKDCQNLVDKNLNWIESKVFYFDKKLKLASDRLKDFEDKILIFGELKELKNGEIDKIEEQSIEYRNQKSLKKILRNQFSDYLFLRCEEISLDMDTSFISIKHRKAKSRWGSCGCRNSLNFNSILLFAPKFVIDYVITHELAHTIHKNHSKSFWDLLELHNQDKTKAKNWLKENYSLLMHMGRYI